MTTSKSILVSELTHSSLFLLQAKLMTSDKRKYSMNKIIEVLMKAYDDHREQDVFPIINFKLENIET